ncbi:MAG: TolC family protein [Methylococcaceae bacterium]
MFSSFLPSQAGKALLRVLLSAIFLWSSAQADEALVVDHHDPIEIETGLTLNKLVALTVEKYPDSAWLEALEAESSAIAQRSNSWTSGANQVSLRYQEATSGTLHYIDAAVQVPLWNLGQRAAERSIADHAQTSATAQAMATQLRVAGLVRVALWDMELQKIRYEQALAEVAVFETLLAQVKKRVQSGDLPRADELLAQTELLQKQSVLTLAEAELMHSRKRYNSITQTTKVPAVFIENLVELKEIESNHPALVAINTQIERKQAEINAAKTIGSGQSNIAIGINSDSLTNDERSNKTESFNIGVNIPFGGSEHLAPQLAALNVELNKLITERELLFRDLKQMHHEAEHNLEVNKVALKQADDLKNLAAEHLKMTELSFSVGEINLIDLLKIQARSQQAILMAKERAVMLQRDRALYNQAVGVMP